MLQIYNLDLKIAKRGPNTVNVYLSDLATGSD
jgi:hypothetical protein